MSEHLRQVAEVALLVVRHADNLGLCPMEGTTTMIPVDDDWSVVVNHACDDATHVVGGATVVIPFLNFAVIHNDMLVGMFTPFGGPMLNGAEDALIEVLKSLHRQKAAHTAWSS